MARIRAGVQIHQMLPHTKLGVQHSLYCTLRAHTCTCPHADADADADAQSRPHPSTLTCIHPPAAAQVCRPTLQTPLLLSNWPECCAAAPLLMHPMVPHGFTCQARPTTPEERLAQLTPPSGRCRRPQAGTAVHGSSLCLAADGRLAVYPSVTCGCSQPVWRRLSSKVAGCNRPATPFCSAVVNPAGSSLRLGRGRWKLGASGAAVSLRPCDSGPAYSSPGRETGARGTPLTIKNLLHTRQHYPEAARA